MRVVITGGREYAFTTEDIAWLDNMHRRYNFTLVIEGGCRRKDYRGDHLPTADRCAYVWATLNGIQTATMEANWTWFKKAGGPIRNGEMAKLAEVCVAFPGGRGTADMVRQATARGLKVLTR